MTVAGDKEPRARSSAHELLMRIALMQHDADTARTEAEKAEAADPKTPLSAFVEGRLLYDQGKFSDAMPHFEQAIAELDRYLAALGIPLRREDGEGTNEGEDGAPGP